MPQLEVSNSSAQSSLELLWTCRTSATRCGPLCHCLAPPGVTSCTIQPILHCVTSLYISAGTDLGSSCIYVHLHRALLHHPELSAGVIWHYHLLPTGCYCHMPSHFLKYWLVETTLSSINYLQRSSQKPLTGYNDCMLSYNYCWHQLMPWITTQPLTSADSHTSPHRSHQQ